MACFSTSCGQRAMELDNGGLLMPRLLPLDPVRPWHGAQEWDFDTGKVSVSLELLMKKVGPEIEEAAARAKVQQWPVYQFFPGRFFPGRRERDDAATVFWLPAPATTRVSLAVRPADSLSLVDMLRFQVPNPGWTVEYPPYLASDVHLVVPKDRDAEAACRLINDDDFVRTATFTTTSDKEVTFRIGSNKLAPEVPGSSPEWPPTGPVVSATAYGVYPSGEICDDLLVNYHHSSEDRNLPRPPSDDQRLPYGVTATVTDASVRVAATSAYAEQVQRLAWEWADALSEVAPPGVQVVVSTSGIDADHQLSPLLRLRFPGMEADDQSFYRWVKTIGGYQAKAPAMSIAPQYPATSAVDSQPTRQYDLFGLQERREVKLEPGLTRVAIDLPWGSWARFVQAPSRGVIELELPETVGIPPLRMTMPDRSPHPEMVGGLLPSVVVRSGSPPVARPTDQTAARHGLGTPRVDEDTPDVWTLQSRRIYSKATGPPWSPLALRR